MPAVRSETALSAQKSKRRRGPAKQKAAPKPKKYSRPSYAYLVLMANYRLSKSSDTQGRSRFNIPQIRDKAVQMADDANHKLGSRASKTLKHKASLYYVKPYIYPAPGASYNSDPDNADMQVTEAFEAVISALDLAIQGEEYENERESFVSLSTHMRAIVDPKELKDFEAECAANPDEISRRHFLGIQAMEQSQASSVETAIAGRSDAPMPFTTPVRPTQSFTLNNPRAYPSPDSLPRRNADRKVPGGSSSNLQDEDVDDEEDTSSDLPLRKPPPQEAGTPHVCCEGRVQELEKDNEQLKVRNKHLEDKNSNLMTRFREHIEAGLNAYKDISSDQESAPNS
ncbi:hypothetical protein CVT24_003578 [Panaeolus cyanescens]|uniref:Uncharacterized protein n=1 Tax=Panaeolus cyanescens TaxID=181874 RepID=A0A409Y7S8_9AGAR|nr:hypothetical protein CVT24_003578 [Panaeolus cyanescens]